MTATEASIEPGAGQHVNAAATAETVVMSIGAGRGWSRQWHTLRHYRAGQVLRRGAAVLRRRLQSGLRVDRYQPARATVFTCGDDLARVGRRKLVVRRDDPRRDGRVADMRRGRWTFLGQTLELGTPLDWRSPRIGQAPRLWQFQLQYHEWLVDLAADTVGMPEAWDHVQRWIEFFGSCTEKQARDAWHPYCISRRIPAWLAVWAQSPPPHEWESRIAGSLAAQAAFLSHHPETDLGGNHLLENARALVLAGAAFRNPAGDDWLDQGLQILERELPGQILPHGEHFERSPMYHCQMTEALEDVHDATRGLRPEFSARCAAVAARMHEFTAAIVHPDGDIPLLGDSAFDEAALPLVDQRGRTRIARGVRRVGDYWTYHDGGDFLLFDAGPVGPDHLPAHAHADLLTIEASFEGLRFLVDSGVHDYEDGEMRQYCRSTAAHSVLEIDGENQCDVYSRFRMGRRGWPTSFECREENGVVWASATHNAYRHLGVPAVGRWIGCGRDGDWLIADWANGGDALHTVVNRLHLHPEVDVAEHSATTLMLERHGVRRWLTVVGRGKLRIVRGWHCPRFGERIATAVVEMRSRTAMPAVLGWRLTREPPDLVPTLNADGGALCVLNWSPAGGQRQLIRLR